MNEKWLYLVKRYTEAGARSKFEEICASLFKKKYLSEDVKTVKVTAGDGGIDIFIGDIRMPIQVIQCKFFVNGIEASQKEQIRSAFKTAIESLDYKCSKWMLCIPDELGIKEHKWWSSWKQKQVAKFQLSDDQIQLIDGADLIDDLKHFGLYNEAFEENLHKYVQDLHESFIDNKFEVESELLSASAFLAGLKNYFSGEESTHLHRLQTDEIVTWVKGDLPGKDLSEKILIVKGKKGVGKSTILKDVYSELLKEDDLLILALKCDQIYNNNLRDLAKHVFNRISSFHLLIEEVGKSGKKLVVILDQLDALSQTLSTERKFILTYIKLISELMSYKNIRIIFSTRAFDLEYDADLRRFNDNKNIKQVEVANLTNEEVKEVLKLLLIETQSEVLVELLRVPYNLELFTKIPNLKDLLKKETRVSLSKLYSELWTQVLSRKDLRITECLDAIVKRMYELHPNLVEQSFLEEFNSDIDYLVSQNILLRNGNKLSFFHQSFYEYYLARWFVTSDKDLIDYIFEEEQNLYVRSLIKTVVEYLREINHQKYIIFYRDILQNENIRFHIKYLLIVELGMVAIPSRKEQLLVVEALKGELRDLFFDTFDSSGWLVFFLKSDLLPITENELYRILFRNLNHDPGSVFRYLESSDLQTKEKLLPNLIPFVNHWDPSTVAFFDKYYPYSQDNQLWYFETLKKIATIDLDLVFKKLRVAILEETLNGERIRFDYRFDGMIDFLFELSSKPLVDFLISIHLDILSRTSYPYYSQYDKVKSSLLSSYQYDNGLFYKDSDEEPSIDHYIIKYYGKCERTELKAFIEQYKNTDYVTMLIVLAKVLRDRAQEVIPEIVELICIIDAKSGFKGIDDFFSLNLRRMITKSILYYNDQQYDIIKRILVSIDSPYEIWKAPLYSGKKFRLSIGRKKFLFIKSLPQQILAKDHELMRFFQEMLRRFGDINSNKAFDRKRSRGGIVGPPLSNANYEKFNDESWLKSMRRINEEYRSDEFLKGGLLEHARVYENLSSKQPFRFYALTKKLFNEDGISWKYISHGISGLIKAKYDPAKIRELIKKEIQLLLDREYTTYAVWHIGYLIESEADITADIVHFLVSVSKDDKYGNDELNPDHPFSDFINTPKGAALHNLLHMSSYIMYEEDIFSTVESVIDPVMSPSNTITCGIMAELAHLNHLNIDRAFRIFRTLVTIGGVNVLKHSINTAQYFNNKYHKEMDFYFDEVLKHEELLEKAYFFVTSWVFLELDDYEMYSNFMKRGERAIKCALEVAEDFLIQVNGVNERAMQILKTSIENSGLDISHQLSGLILRKFQPEYFELLYSFMEQYVTTEYFKMDPRYLLEYLTTCSANHPLECLKLLCRMALPEKVDISRTAFIGNEALTLLLSIYSRLRSEPLKFGKEQYIVLDTFDRMLHIPTFRSRAVEAMENVLH